MFVTQVCHTRSKVMTNTNFINRQTNKQTDIGSSRITFATENSVRCQNLSPNSGQDTDSLFLQIVILMPAVCSICYHSFKYKYGLGPEDSEHQVINESSLRFKVSSSKQ